MAADHAVGTSYHKEWPPSVPQYRYWGKPLGETKSNGAALANMRSGSGETLVSNIIGKHTHTWPNC